MRFVERGCRGTYGITCAAHIAGEFPIHGNDIDPIDERFEGRRVETVGFEVNARATLPQGRGQRTGGARLEQRFTARQTREGVSSGLECVDRGERGVEGCGVGKLAEGSTPALLL